MQLTIFYPFLPEYFCSQEGNDTFFWNIERSQRSGSVQNESFRGGGRKEPDQAGVRKFRSIEMQRQDKISRHHVKNLPQSPLVTRAICEQYWTRLPHKTFPKIISRHDGIRVSIDKKSTCTKQQASRKKKKHGIVQFNWFYTRETHFRDDIQLSSPSSSPLPPRIPILPPSSNERRGRGEVLHGGGSRRGKGEGRKGFRFVSKGKWAAESKWGISK